jgi:hypothetical protein
VWLPPSFPCLVSCGSHSPNLSSVPRSVHYNPISDSSDEFRVDYHHLKDALPISNLKCQLNTTMPSVAASPKNLSRKEFKPVRTPEKAVPTVPLPLAGGDVTIPVPIPIPIPIPGPVPGPAPAVYAPSSHVSLLLSPPPPPHLLFSHVKLLLAPSPSLSILWALLLLALLPT